MQKYLLDFLGLLGQLQTMRDYAQGDDAIDHFSQLAFEGLVTNRPRPGSGPNWQGRGEPTIVVTIQSMFPSLSQVMLSDRDNHWQIHTDILWLKTKIWVSIWGLMYGKVLRQLKATIISLLSGNAQRKHEKKWRFARYFLVQPFYSDFWTFFWQTWTLSIGFKNDKRRYKPLLKPSENPVPKFWRFSYVLLVNFQKPCLKTMVIKGFE